MRDDTSFQHRANIAEKELFHRILSRERKRSERSGESILLLMLDVSRIEDARTKEQVLTVASGEIAGVIRETDACGWLDTGTVLGILFPGIMDNVLTQAIHSIEVKVKEHFAAHLPQVVCQRMRYSIVTFPGRDNDKAGADGIDALFYPEIFTKDLGDRTLEAVKRGVDLVGSLLALILLSPLFAAIAALIRLTSPGPVFYKQERVGQFGKPFTFYKFRSMYVNNDDSIHRRYVRELIANKVAAGNGDEVFKIRKDPRVTPLGLYLRKSSLDELPQFYNVLKGEMSLVGPRPPIPYEVKDYDLWHRFRILGRKPGITGLWQVRGRSKTTFDGMVRLDIRYIRSWSLWLDLKLLLATPMAVLRGKGAY